MPPVDAISQQITITLPDGNDIAAWWHILIEATVVKHNFLTGAAIVLWSYYPKAPFQAIRYIFWTLPKDILVGLLRCLGFGEGGIERESFASQYQAAYYGGYVDPYSHFAFYQSIGATGYNQISYETVSDEPDAWDIFGWLLFCAGLAIMFLGDTMGN